MIKFWNSLNLITKIAYAILILGMLIWAIFSFSSFLSFIVVFGILAAIVIVVYDIGSRCGL